MFHILLFALLVIFVLSSHQSIRPWEISRANAILAEQSAKVLEGERPSCGGLLKKMCKPCPKSGPKEWCDHMVEECSRLFCDPMCKTSTWKCSVQLKGSMSEIGKDERIAQALCAEFIAHGCSSVIQCCPQDHTLLEFVENGVYADQYPIPLLPPPKCDLDLADEIGAKKICKECTSSHSSVKVQVSEKCPFPVPAAEQSGGKKSLLELDSLLEMEGHSHTGRTVEIPILLGQNDNVVLLAEESTMVKEKGKGKGAQFPGLPVYKSLQERCEEVLKMVKKKKKSMESQFTKILCNCLGCCKSKECYFPVTEILPK